MESTHHEHQVPIWFFVGMMLFVYGLLITGAGIYALGNPTEVQKHLQEHLPKIGPAATWFFLHPDIWWGAIMAVVGLLYCLRFNPLRPGETLTGRE